MATIGENLRRALRIYGGLITANLFWLFLWLLMACSHRPSVDARLFAASEALVGYIWMAAFIGIFA